MIRKDDACGHIQNFGLDAPVNMAAAAGLHIEMRVLEPA